MHTAQKPDLGMTLRPIDFQLSMHKENGLRVVDAHDIPLPGNFDIVDRFLVTVPPGENTGNHSHTRRHAFVALTPGLELLVEINGTIERHVMFDKDVMRVWVTPASAPHAVVNPTEQLGFLYEINDSKRGEQFPANLLG